MWINLHYSYCTVLLQQTMHHVFISVIYWTRLSCWALQRSPTPFHSLKTRVALPPAPLVLTALSHRPNYVVYFV